MLLEIHVIGFLISVAFSGTEAGSISESFLNSFSNDGEKKDAILEFPPVIEKVLSDPSLSSLEGDERRTKIVGLLQQHTSTMQAPVLSALGSMGLKDKAKPFWVANKIAVSDVPLSSLKVMSSIPGPFTIREAQTVKSFPLNLGSVMHEQPISSNNREKRAVQYQWGVELIEAPKAFQNGINGTGSVLGVIDTGCSLTHVALKSNYRGGAYSWKDTINNRSSPYDDNGHGTHVTGTAVGTENGIGVAPGAQWISCKGLDSEGSGTEANLTICGQFMACPNNSSGSCTDYPNVVSCSWGGNQNDPFYNPVLRSWIALNIVPVFAIGNDGPGCGTAHSPGDQPDLISVGSVDQNDTVSSFSSRGTGGNMLQRLLKIGPKKPEVSAPGRNVVSADYKNDNGYIAYSGTSMATPHVAGTVALLLSKEKGLTFEEVRQRLESTAVKHTTSRCQRLLDLDRQQNNEYGFGRISVPKALRLQ